ncbi:proteoglycan 4b isoform X1 [Acanthochromis polyacanthus]|uniref:proteoglycan 4b isoform X1 n=1 Tax=Acanthochromis polyacanthus TaxID=80966 RepID=UPI00223425AF|nr:proteoglycan 4b isoform X1 [Acanthochromis polyacanthus]
MSSTVFYTLILLACALKFSASQTSCKGRCGAEYYRGYMCQCDYGCLSYGECCRDFESQCTTKNSCLGRCGEGFKRGRLCSCDPDCVKYKQCCPDYKRHCDAEEEISGSSSATAPVKTNSCDNVNNNKPKEPTLNDATEQPSTFSKGNDADDYVIPPDGLTDELGDDINKISPVDDFSNNGVEELEASPIPQTSSGYGPTTADPLSSGSTEPTVVTDTMEFTTESVTVILQTETPPDVADLFTLDSTTGEAPTESTGTSDFTSSPDVGTASPEPTTAAVDDSTQPSATSEPQTEPSAPTSITELETVGQSETPATDGVFPSEEPEATTVPSTTIPDPSTLDSTATPEETTSNPNTESNSGDVTTGPPSSLADVKDDSTNISPEGSELDPATTDLPSSTAAVQDNTTDDVPPEITTADPLKVTPKPTNPPTSEPSSKPQDKPDPYKPLPVIPTSKPETKPLEVEQTSNVDDTRGFQGDDSNDTNLCSGRPVGAVATLRNGTVAVFRGHYFWFLDRNRVPGPAQGITQVWGVPSPVDTAFTRCNCQGKTYIFKGNQYWRFENDALDPGYPKAVSTGFDGLRGHITAALSVPQHQTRRESVYFFKRGGYVQKYSYQFGTSPTCSRKPQYAIYTVRNRVARQAVSVLEPAINIRTTWRGFPSTITAAVSVPNNREPEGYKYFVFSRTKSYNVRMNGERPVIAAPKANTTPQSNDIFKCPKKV